MRSTVSHSEAPAEVLTAVAESGAEPGVEQPPQDPAGAGRELDADVRVRLDL